jgi:hypothetical protein
MLHYLYDCSKITNTHLNPLIFLLHALLLTSAVLWLKRYYQAQKAPLAPFLIPAFVLKVWAGLAYGWLYIVYYGGTGDSLNYFRAACRFADFAWENPTAYLNILFFNEFYLIPDLAPDLWGQVRYLWMVKLVSLVNITTGNNYWLTSCYFSFVSFWGMWTLGNTLARVFPQTAFSAGLAFLFVPSIVFFSSGLTKESLAMACVGFMVARFLVLCFREQPLQVGFIFQSILLFLCSSWALWQVKFYYLVGLILAIFSFLIGLFAFQFFKKNTPNFSVNTWLQGVCIVFISIFIFVAGGFILDYDSLFLLSIVYNHNSTYIHAQPDDLIQYAIQAGQGYITLHATWWSIGYNAPLALVSTLFRPFVWEVGGDKLKLLVSLENSAVLIAFLYALVYFLRKPWQESAAIKRHYLLFIACLIALASPNFGSLIRYRVAVYPFFVYLCLIPWEAILTESGCLSKGKGL